MEINQLKKELGLSQQDLADFFDMNYGSFANSSAKERYENALCSFYEVAIHNVVGRYSQEEIEAAYDKGLEDGYACVPSNL